MVSLKLELGVADYNVILLTCVELRTLSAALP